MSAGATDRYRSSTYNSRGARERTRSEPYDTKGARLGSDDRQERGRYGELEDEQDPRLQGFLKISKASNVKAVAGKIAHSCREGDPPGLLTIGNSCINQAVKSIAIAAKYLVDDGFELSFQPAFRDKDRTRPSLAFYLAKQRRGSASRFSDEVELPVSSGSVPGVVAGALAARVRENKSPYLTAIGVDAVTNAVLAVGNARLYLEDENLDIRVLPQFVHVSKGGTELSAVKFQITTENV